MLHKLCITNTYFQAKAQHKVSCWHPHFKNWHELDLILTWCKYLRNDLMMWSFQSTDCDADHSLVCCKLRLQLKRMHYARPPRQTAYQCYHDQELNQICNIHQVSERCPLRKQTKKKCSAEIGYSQEHHTQHWTLLGGNGARHWVGSKQVQRSSTWPLKGAHCTIGAQTLTYSSNVESFEDSQMLQGETTLLFKVPRN